VHAHPAGFPRSASISVFGEGNPRVRLVFVGEAPGKDEDVQGRPFVGRAGERLTRIIEAIDLTREEVYICNIIKCQPPENRKPLPDEIEACLPFLKKQLAAINPKIICCLGTFAARPCLRPTSASRSPGAAFTTIKPPCSYPSTTRPSSCATRSKNGTCGRT
jgi:uracil-DNA glycosylase family 4